MTQVFTSSACFTTTARWRLCAMYSATPANLHAGNCSWRLHWTYPIGCSEAMVKR